MITEIFFSLCGLHNPQYKKKLCIAGYTTRNVFKKNLCCRLYYLLLWCNGNYHISFTPKRFPVRSWVHNEHCNLLLPPNLLPPPNNNFLLQQLLQQSSSTFVISLHCSHNPKPLSMSPLSPTQHL